MGKNFVGNPSRHPILHPEILTIKNFCVILIMNLDFRNNIEFPKCADGSVALSGCSSSYCVYQRVRNIDSNPSTVITCYMMINDNIITNY